MDVLNYMNLAEDFEDRLMALDPGSDEFVLAVDDLLESMPMGCHESLVPSIFRFFEKYPLESGGAPGSLVHFAENFYPNYKSILVDSLAHAPSCSAILMINRILNANLSKHERQEYLSALVEVAVRIDIPFSLVQQAKDFIDYQATKHG